MNVTGTGFINQLQANSIFLGGQPLSISSNVTLTAVTGQITLTQTNATNLQVGLADFGSVSTCAWANVATDAKGRTTCTSNTAPLTSLLAGIGTYITSTNRVNTYVASVKDYGAVGDGTTDDSTAIQTAINAQTGALFFPSGRYIIGTGLQFSYSNQFYFGLQDVFIVPGVSLANGSVMLAIQNCSNVTFSGINFDGGATYSSPKGLVLSVLRGSLSMISFRQVKFENANQALVTDLAISLDRLLLEECAFRNFASFTVLLTFPVMNTIRVRRCSVENAFAGITIASSSVLPAQAIDVQDNYFALNNYGYFALALQVSGVAANIIGNTFLRSRMGLSVYGFVSSLLSNSTIDSNVFSTMSTVAMELTTVSQVVITGNQISNCENGIQIYGASDLTIVGNNIGSSNGSLGYGIYVFTYDGLLVTNLVVTGNSFSELLGGVRLDNCTSCIVSGNVFSNARLFAANATTFTVSANTFTLSQAVIDGYATVWFSQGGININVLSNAIVATRTDSISNARGVWFAGTGSYANVTVNGNTIIRHSIGIDYSSGGGITFASANIGNNFFVNNGFNRLPTAPTGTNIIYAPERMASYSFVSPPIYTSWSAGDIVSNTGAAGNCMALQVGTQSGTLVGVPTQTALGFPGDSDRTLTPCLSTQSNYVLATLTANRTWTLSVTNAFVGTTWKLSFGPNLGAFFVRVQNAAGTLIKLMGANMWAHFQWDGGANYYVVAQGTL